MKKPTVRITFLLLFISSSLTLLAQTKSKDSKKDFCGVKINKKQNIIETFQPQFDFIALQENDTLVDIGAESGWYEGAMSVALPFKNLTFYLVDINSNCLNETKVNSMIAHYSKAKEEAIKNKFIMVNNTVDSLWLPLNHFKKVCIFNTLHEIPDQAKMVRDINKVLKAGGEAIVLELAPRKPNELHGGCHKPLLTLEQINKLFTENGFALKKDTSLLPFKGAPIQLVKFVKTN